MNHMHRTFKRPTWQEKVRLPKYLPGVFAIPSVASSVVSMVFLGPIWVMVLYVLWLPRIFYKGQLRVGISRSTALPAIILCYSLLSTAWSVHPEITLRAALEFSSLVCCA